MNYQTFKPLKAIDSMQLVLAGALKKYTNGSRKQLTRIVT